MFLWGAETGGLVLCTSSSLVVPVLCSGGARGTLHISHDLCFCVLGLACVPRLNPWYSTSQSCLLAVLPVALLCQCACETLSYKYTQEKAQSTFHSHLANPHQQTPRQPGPQCRTGQDGHLSLEAGKGEGNGQFTPAVQTSRPSCLFLPESPVSTPAWLRATQAPPVSAANTL